MFKAFCWMFADETVKKMVLKNCAIMSGVALVPIIILFLAAIISFNSPFALMFGSALFILAVICLFIPPLLVNGYFWETTSNIIDRKTEIVSASTYDGNVKHVEKITLTNINIPKYLWRGFAASVAMLILELPVILIALSLIIFDVKQLWPGLLAVQIGIWILAPGLCWNYAKNNSIFSILNVYTAGHLIEEKFGRYVWNGFLSILNGILYFIMAFLLNNLFSAPLSPDINNTLSLLKYCIYIFIMYIPWLYTLHVQAFLIGTLGNTDDF